MEEVSFQFYLYENMYAADIWHGEMNGLLFRGV